MKITLVIDSLGLGGAQRQLVALACHLARQGDEVDVVSLCDQLLHYKAELEQAGVPVTVIPQKGKFSFSAFWKMHKKVNASKPDILHCWLFSAGLYGRLAGFFAGVKHMLYGVRNTLWDMKPVYKAVDKILAGITARILVNAKSLKHELTRSEKYSAARIQTVHNGIDPEQFEAGYDPGATRAEWAIPDGAQVVAMVARMAEQKDHACFLRAAKRVLDKGRKAVFVLVGDGPKRPVYERLAEELGITGNVRFVGARRDVFQLFPAVDICALATFSEGCSNVIMEAMAAGKPVVATNIGGNAELIREGQSGYLVPQESDTVMAERLVKILGDPELGKVMGRLGRQIIEADFSMERMVRETRDVYQKLCEGE